MRDHGRLPSKKLDSIGFIQNNNRRYCLLSYQSHWSSCGGDGDDTREWCRRPTRCEDSGFLKELLPDGSFWCRSGGTRWHGIVRVAVEVSAGDGFADPAPLFEEEQGALLVTLCFDGAYPFGAHGSCAGAAFAAHDDPVDAREVDGAEVFKEWFDAQEPEACRGATQLVDSWDAVLLVLDADAPPDMLCHRCLWDGGGEELLEAVGAFGEDLVGVPVGPEHDGGDGRDVLVGHGVLEEVAHAVDEHRARASSEQNCTFARLIKQLLTPLSATTALGALTKQSGLGLVMASKIYRFCCPDVGAAVDRHSSYFFNSLPLQVEGGPPVSTCTRFKRQWANGQYRASRLAIYTDSRNKHCCSANVSSELQQALSRHAAQRPILSQRGEVPDSLRTVRNGASHPARLVCVCMFR